MAGSQFLPARRFATIDNKRTPVGGVAHVILAGPPAFANTFSAEVAQLVEHVTENHGVGGSIPSLGTIRF